MHARCLRAAVARAHRPARRFLTTALEQQSTASSTSPLPESSTDNANLADYVDDLLLKNPTSAASTHDAQTSAGTSQDKKQKVHEKARAVMVKVEYGVKNLPMGLAIVQETERRFGRIRDFKLLPVSASASFLILDITAEFAFRRQDRNSPGDYLPYLFIEFENAHITRRVLASEKKTFKFTIEPWNREQLVDGGASLYDVQDYLRRPIHAGEPEEPQTPVEKDTPTKASEDTEEKPSTSTSEGDLETEIEPSVSETSEEGSEKYFRPRNEVHVQFVPLGL